jgi:hypothetical protein
MSLKTSTTAGVLGSLVALSIFACSSEKDAGPSETDPGGPIFGEDGVDFGEEPGDGSGLPGGQSCVGETAGAESAPAVLQLVVDTSGSMDQDAPGTRGSKWTVTRDALLGAINRMPGDTAVGVVFYPDVSIDADTCFDNDADVAISRLEESGSGQRNQIRRAFQNQSPDGGTPTHDAYRYAFTQLEATTAVGSRFAVVITDGTPTFSLGCEGTGLIRDPVDPAPLVVEAANATSRGVSTFVIGSPGSEGARESLSRMAEAGGTAKPGCSHRGPNYCHFDMTEELDFASALTDALGTISGLALSCSYDIPAPPAGATLDPARVNVLFSPSGGPQELIGKNGTGPCNEGWQYSADGTQVLLCGSTCDRVRSSDGSLELQFGCETQLR